MIPAFQNLSNKETDIYSLVLSATGIEYKIIHTINGYEILTFEESIKDSEKAVSLYLNENLKNAGERPAFTTRFHKTYSGLFMAFFIFIIHYRINSGYDPHEFVNKLCSSASKILEGEYYRCITSLLLHGNDMHLVGNMAGLIVFGTAVCSLAGSGIGWFLILLSGFLGNYFNALFYQTFHRSIGASTAVFGAIGILAGYQLVNNLEKTELKFNSLITIGAGFGLLAMLGSSPNSDIMAHLFGYIAGVIIGAIYRLFFRQPVSEKYQILFLVISATIVAGCWMRGMG